MRYGDINSWLATNSEARGRNSPANPEANLTYGNVPKLKGLLPQRFCVQADLRSKFKLIFLSRIEPQGLHIS